MEEGKEKILHPREIEETCDSLQPYLDSTMEMLNDQGYTHCKISVSFKRNIFEAKAKYSMNITPRHKGGWLTIASKESCKTSVDLL